MTEEEFATLGVRYFKPGEFREWLPLVFPGLVLALDAVREHMGGPLVVSPARGALGRRAGQSYSLHNVDRWGKVYAADVFFPAGVPLDVAYGAVRMAGVVSGIGVYPDWRPRPGLHLDLRHMVAGFPGAGATPAAPATWAGLRMSTGKQGYFALSSLGFE